MLKKKILYSVFIGSITLMILSYMFVGSEENYIATVEKQRQEYHEFLSSNANSPFKGTGKYLPPKYFDISQEYSVIGKVERLSSSNIITLAATKGAPRSYLKYALIRFTLKGTPCTLAVYQNMEDVNDLLLPFSDQSNGSTTYPVGRYLNIKAPLGSETTLDFNLAHNPFCAYNDEYSCPIPPEENRLTIAVEAGEKYSQSH